MRHASTTILHPMLFSHPPFTIHHLPFTVLPAVPALKWQLPTLAAQILSGDAFGS